MHKMVWTDEAIERLEAIITYVSVYDPAEPERLGRRLIELADIRVGHGVGSGLGIMF